MTNGQFAVRVVNAKPGSNGARLYFEVVHGVTDDQGTFYGATVTKNCALRDSSRTGKPYISWPSKVRTRKGADPLTLVIQTDPQKNNQPIYDNQADLYSEGTGTDRKVTKFGWEVNQSIIDQAIALESQLNSASSGRGAKAAPAGMATTTGTAAAPSVFGGDDDSELPF